MQQRRQQADEWFGAAFDVCHCFNIYFGAGTLRDDLAMLIPLPKQAYSNAGEAVDGGGGDIGTAISSFTVGCCFSTVAPCSLKVLCCYSRLSRRGHKSSASWVKQPGAL